MTRTLRLALSLSLLAGTAFAGGKTTTPLTFPTTVLTIPSGLVAPLTLTEGLCLSCADWSQNPAHAGLLLPTSLPEVAIPGVLDEAGSQSRLLLREPDIRKGLARLEQLAGLAGSDQSHAAEAGHAAALNLGVLTAADLPKLLIQSPAHRGLLQTLEPDDAAALLAASGLVRQARRGDAGLLRQLARIEARLKSLSLDPASNDLHAELSRIADNAPAVSAAADLSPTFSARDDAERLERAARALRGLEEVELEAALKGVELPPVLAYKAAAIALRKDLTGVFSEVGAAQKISGDFYKIRGQRAIQASYSPYAREASDLRYGQPKANPVSEDYTSVARLRQQLFMEYSIAPVRPGKAKFVVADTARTSWGDGHAWLGVLAQPDPAAEPVEVVLHVRLVGTRTRNQKDVLGALGVSALYGAYHHRDDIAEFVRGLGDGLAKQDFEVDFLSIKGPDGKDLVDLPGHAALLREGLTRQVLLDPDGVPVAPAQAASGGGFKRWRLLRGGRPVATALHPFAEKAPPQAEPELVHQVTLSAYDPALKERRWTLLSLDGDQAPEDFQKRFFPAGRGIQNPAAASGAGDAHSVIDFKAKRLNRAAWVKGVFADIGGYQAVATRFFEASNSHAVFESLSFPSKDDARVRYGGQGARSDLDFLRLQLGVELARLKGHDSHSKFGIDRPHRKFSMMSHASEAGGELRGLIGLRLQDEPGGPTSDTVVAFRFRGGTWQDRRNALAALGVNLLHAMTFGAPSEAHLMRALREGMPALGAFLKVTDATGASAAALGR